MGGMRKQHIEFISQRKLWKTRTESGMFGPLNWLIGVFARFVSSETGLVMPTLHGRPQALSEAGLGSYYLPGTSSYDGVLCSYPYSSESCNCVTQVDSQ